MPGNEPRPSSKSGDPNGLGQAQGEPGSLTGHAVRGVAWITAGRVLKTPLKLVAIVVLARLLSPSDFGIVAIATLVVTFSNVIVDGSFGLALIQRRQLDPESIGATLALSFALALLLSICVVLGSPFVEQQFAFPQLREVLLFLAVLLPINAVTSVTTALMQRAFQFGRLTFNATLSQLAYTVVAIALAATGFGLWSLVWAHLAQFAADALLGYLVVRTRYSVRFTFTAARDVLKTGGMFTVSKLLNWGANNIDNLMIGRFLGAAALGFYSRAFSLMSTARQLSGTGPIRVLFASFARIQHDPERMARAYLRALSVTLIAATLVSAFVVVSSDVIVRLLLGPQWLPTIPVLQIMFSAFVARTGYIVAEAVPLALGLTGQSALRQGAQLILVMVGAAVGAQFGLVPAVIGITTAYWIFYVFCLLLVQRLIPISWLEVLRRHLNGIILSLPPSVLALAARWALPADNLLLQSIPLVIFAIVAAAVIAVAPTSLVSDDIARFRTLAWERLCTTLRGLHTTIREIRIRP
jgi:O-antigen/teichoic acid export membrane protein